MMASQSHQLYLLIITKTIGMVAERPNLPMGQQRDRGCKEHFEWTYLNIIKTWMKITC